MANRLTKKQKGFVKDYLETGIAGLAAERNYDVKDNDSARAIGSENLTKPNIIALIENHAEKSVAIIVELADTAKNENVKLGANKDILDRAGYKPIEKTQTQSVNVNVNITPERLAIAKEYEDKLKETL